MTGRVAAAALLLSLVASTASAQSLRASTAAVVQQSAATWQRDYDAARAHKSKAKQKIFIGLGASIGGIFLAAAGADSCVDTIISGSDCSTSSGLMTVGWITNLAGDGLFVWGLIDYFDASGDINRLLAQKPSGGPALTLSDHQAIALSAGRQKTLSYRVSW